jgi:peptidyl-prolyl cis-trans isomerase C
LVCLFVVLVPFLSACQAASPASQVESGARKVITFDGGEVTEGEVREGIERLSSITAAQTGGAAPKIEPGSPQYEGAKRQVVPQLLILNLTEAYARENGIRVSENEIHEEVEQAKEELAERAEAVGQGGEDPEELFQEALDQLGYTESSFREEARRSLLVRKVQEEVAGGDEPTQEEIEEFYNENRSAFAAPEQRCIRHILFSPDEEEEAEQARQQLENRGDFEELARENSQDPGSRERGGELGCQPRGGFVPEFEEAAFEAQEGELVGPVETDFGFHLLEVTEIRPAGEESLEDVAPEIRERLSQQRQAAELDVWIQDQLEERNVKYLPEYDPARPTPSGLPKGAPKGDAPEGQVPKGDVPREEASEKDAPKIKGE